MDRREKNWTQILLINQRKDRNLCARLLGRSTFLFPLARHTINDAVQCPLFWLTRAARSHRSWRKKKNKKFICMWFVCCISFSYENTDEELVKINDDNTKVPSGAVATISIRIKWDQHTPFRHTVNDEPTRNTHISVSEPYTLNPSIWASGLTFSSQQLLLLTRKSVLGGFKSGLN